MIAFDTNLLVRLVVNDDHEQADIAEALLKANRVFISRTVLLESEWVLRSVYNNARPRIHAFFKSILEAENAVIEDHDAVERALIWYNLNADFADALHLAACGAALLHTFDQGFCTQAREQGLAPLVRVLTTT